MSHLMTFRLSALIFGLLTLAACGAGHDIEAACEAAGHKPGTAAFSQCVDEAYEFQARLSNRYRSGGP